MDKDNQEKKAFMQNMKTVSVSAGLSGQDNYIFDSKEQILESIRAEGFEPVVAENSYQNLDGDDIPYITVDLVCKHGHSETSREYTQLKDGKWEFIEEGYGLPCPECEKEE